MTTTSKPSSIYKGLSKSQCPAATLFTQREAPEHFDRRGELSGAVREDIGLGIANVAPPPVALTSTRYQDEASFAPPVEEQLWRQSYPPWETSTLWAWRPQLPLTKSAASAKSSTTPQHRLSPSPTQLKTRLSPTLTGDLNGEQKVQNRADPISAWFQGSSEPVQLGFTIKEQASSHSATSAPSNQPQNTDMQSIAESLRPALGSGGRLSFFKPKPARHTTLAMHEVPGDAFLNADVSTLLFPSGALNSEDPSSFKTLQSNAEAALSRMQAAYKLRTVALQEKTIEQDALQDERDEAETRSRLLKEQLEEMATKMTEKEKVIKELVDELMTEKQRRVEEEEARLLSITLVKAPIARNSENHGPASPATTAAESACDSDRDSLADSVFSSRRSRRLSSSSSHTRITTPDHDRSPELSELPSPFQSAYLRPASATVTPVRPTPVQRLSTFQRILKGMSIKPSDPESLHPVEDAPACPHCHGCNTDYGSNSTNDLRVENDLLREKIAGLELAVESCLDLVGRS